MFRGSEGQGKLEKVMKDREIVAVFFGGSSVEHDVSILTGLQIIEAIDSTKYNVLPVYVSPDGGWYVGDALLDRKNYPLNEQTKKKLDRVQFSIGSNSREEVPGLRRPMLTSVGGFGFRTKTYGFDIAIPSIHGTSGEDGALQGLFEFAGVPYVGARILAASFCMNKRIAKRIFRSLNIPTLDSVSLLRSDWMSHADVTELRKRLGTIGFPCCVKPCNLGSSVAVKRAGNFEDFEAHVLNIFQLDNEAIIEPLVPNLTEYNIAVTRAFGGTQTSAIERPVSAAELLDFKDKYLAQGGLDTKLAIPFSEGMASATRVINPPELGLEQAERIASWAKQVFEVIDGRGTSRVDYLCNGATGEIWMNELNTFPGSLAYYLWQAADPPVPFTDLLTALIKEGLDEHRNQRRSTDPMQGGATIFPRN